VIIRCWRSCKSRVCQTRLEFIKMMRLGGDIAAWCAFDMKPEPIASALKRAAGLYQNVARNRSKRDGTRLRHAASTKT
jgi:hypothetical protein